MSALRASAPASSRPGRASSALAAGALRPSASLKVSDVSGETTDSTSSIPARSSLIACSVGEVVADEQIGDVGVGLGRGEQQDHGLAAEQSWNSRLSIAICESELR